MKEAESVIAVPLFPMAGLALKDSKIKPFSLSTIGAASSNCAKTAFLFEIEFTMEELAKPVYVGIILFVSACWNLEHELMPETRSSRLIDLVVFGIQPIAGIPVSPSWSEDMN
jgi:hypothetical protein